MTTFDLGHGARCDLETLLESRLLAQANSGGGKSWLLRRILEQTHGHVQHIVIDPEGEFATLRERYDYVLGAKRGGETVAEPRAAPLLAERLLELRVSAVLDIYELKAAERVRFVEAFLEALVNVPKRLWHPVLVVLDEAHVFCPESGKGRQQRTGSASAVIDLCTRGRKRGFCAILATQRLSKLNKDAAAECNNVLIGRTGLDQDQKRAADVLGFTSREERLALRDLDPKKGEFWAFGPAIATSPTKIRVGPVKTTHPKVGGRLNFEAPPPTAKVRKLLPQLADLPTEAEERSRTVEDLRRDLQARDRRIRELERAQPVVSEPERVEVPVLGTDATDALREAMVAMKERSDDLWQMAGVVNEAADRIIAAVEKVQNHRQPAVPHVPKGARRPPAVARPARARRPPSTGEDGDLTGPEQRILDALAWLEDIGVQDPEVPAVAFMARYRPSGGAFNNPRGRLRAKGLIDYVGAGQMRLTDAGRALAQHIDVPPDRQGLHQMVLDRLDGPERRILKPLLDVYPDPLPNEQLAELAGYSPNGGAYNNPRGRLRTLGLVDYPSQGLVVAREVLFP